MDPIKESYFTGATSSQDYLSQTKKNSKVANTHLTPGLAVQVLVKSLDIDDP